MSAPLTRDQQRLVVEGKRLVKSLARRLARLQTTVLYDDLHGWGTLALVDAARTFDPARGSFESHAWTRIQGELWDRVRKEQRYRSRIVEASRAAAMRFTEGLDERGGAFDEEGETTAHLDDLLGEVTTAWALGAPSALAGIDPEHAMLQREDYAGMRARVDSALAELSTPDRRLLEMRYAFRAESEHDKGHTYEQIAEALGHSLSKVQRAHQKLMPRLRALLESKGATKAEGTRGDSKG